MKSAQEIQAALAQCHCTESYRYNDITKAQNMVYSDGVKRMVEMCNGFWLLSAIASHQPHCMEDPKGMAQSMQFWTLTVKDNKAVLKCERDQEDIFLTQDIGFSDFPLPEIKIWLQRGMVNIDGQPKEMMIAILPTEY